MLLKKRVSTIKIYPAMAGSAKNGIMVPRGASKMAVNQ
jgi:hypothetical protein